MLKVLNCASICKYSLKNNKCPNKFCQLTHFKQSSSTLFPSLRRKKMGKYKSIESRMQNKINDPFEDWLINIVGLPQYLDKFRETGSTEPSMIPFFDEDLFRNDIRIKNEDHIKLFILGVEKYKNINNIK